jgi:PKD repeat protein
MTVLSSPWPVKYATPDPALAGEQLTYTLDIVNGESFTLTATITDILPASVTPTGTITWTSVSILPGETWTETIVVTVHVGYHGELTNVLQVTSVEGYSGAFTLTTPVYIPVQADFAAKPTAGLPPLTVVFTNTSTGDYDTSLWLFGDEIASTLESPTHTYTAAGAYTVTLIVDGPGGTDTEVKPQYITVQYGVYLPLLLSSG